MKTTKSVNPDFKALREKAGLTLGALAAQIDYSPAAVNGLENNNKGGKRLRQAVLEALTAATGGGTAVGHGEAEGGGGEAAPDEMARALERARVAEEKLDRMYEVIADLLKRRGGDSEKGGEG